MAEYDAGEKAQSLWEFIQRLSSDYDFQKDAIEYIQYIERELQDAFTAGRINAFREAAARVRESADVETKTAEHWRVVERDYRTAEFHEYASDAFLHAESICNSLAQEETEETNE